MALLGLVSLFMTTSIFLDLFGIRAKEGNYVDFIVGANLICSFIYLISAYGLATQKVWTTKLLSLAVAILIIAFLGLGVHISNGGIYETKTVKAMSFRTILTIIFTIISSIHLNQD